MATPRSADEPDLDAVRNGAPVYDGGAVDARVVAAERVIAQLRLLLGVLVDEAGGTVTLSREQLLRAEVRGVRIVDTLQNVTLTLPGTDRPRLRVATAGEAAIDTAPEGAHPVGAALARDGEGDDGRDGDSTTGAPARGAAKPDPKPDPGPHSMPDSIPDSVPDSMPDEPVPAAVVETSLQRRIARMLADHVTSPGHTPHELGPDESGPDRPGATGTLAPAADSTNNAGDTGNTARAAQPVDP